MNDSMLRDVVLTKAIKGFRIEIVLLNYIDFMTLGSSLGARAQYVQLKSSKKTFEGLRVHSLIGPVDVFPIFDSATNVPEYYGKKVTIVDIRKYLTDTLVKV